MTALVGPRRTFTEEQDAEIIRVYRAKIFGGNQRLARQYKVSRSLISKRAKKLGAGTLIERHSNPAGTIWREEELRIIFANICEPMNRIRTYLRDIGCRNSETSLRRLLQFYRRPYRSNLPSEHDNR